MNWLDVLDDETGAEVAPKAPSDREYVHTYLTDHRLLSAGEEEFLSERSRAGDLTAREILVRHNMRLVVSVAQHFRPRDEAFTSGGLEFGDLVQEGMVALSRAAASWEPGVGASFATYAKLAIERQVIRAISTLEESIRLPRQMRILESQMRRVENQRATQGLPRPSAAEFAELLDVDVAAVQAVLDAPHVTTSLNRTVGEENDTELLDLQVDPSAGDFTEETSDYSPRQIREALAKLKPRDREILVKRHAEGKDLKQTGKELGVSAERVRAQERRAEGKFRRALRATEVAPSPRGGLSL